MEIDVGGGVGIDAQALLTGRCCVIGQSGSGKSYLVGVIAEELSKNGLPYVIIDTEGEYYSLKSAFDAIWVGGEGADLPLDADYERLFEKSMEAGVPVIFDVSEELDKAGRVESMLSVLYALGEKARSPYLVIIEEADKFAPQVMHKEFTKIEEISVRGRKRGIGLLVATQRPANINKNVLAQCSYGFVGKLTIENDIKSVNVLFDDKKVLAMLPSLKTGEFISFGLGENLRFKVKERGVKHGGATPQLKQKAHGKVDVRALIRDIGPAAEGGSTAIKTETDAKAMQQVVKETVGEEFARGYAERLLKRRFLVFGGRVEALESIREKFIPICIAMLRIPTGRRNEFEERYVIIDGKLNALALTDGIRRGEAISNRKARLNDTEKKLLAAISGRKASDIEDIARKSGLSEAAAFKAIDRLEDYNIISIKGNTIKIPDRRRLLLHGKPELVDRVIDSCDIVGERLLQKGISDAISTAFPLAEIASVRKAFIPFYEINLRQGDRVRVFRIDALFGKELDPGIF